MAQLAAVTGILSFSCAAGVRPQESPTSSAETGEYMPGVAVHVERSADGLRFFFQDCHTGKPAMVRGYVLVAELHNDGTREPVCVIEQENMQCGGATWQYGQAPQGWTQVRLCNPLRTGTTYRVSVESGAGIQHFTIEDDGSVQLLDGFCAFKPAGGPAADAERQRYGWACKSTGP
jgi:hypothetical protein